MNEYMQQIANAATPILCLLITALGLYLVALLRKATAKLKDQAENNTADKYIDMACEAVAQAVMATAQTFVDTLKAEGAFTKEKQLEAFNMAKETALAILGETVVTALNGIYGDFDAWINTRIEAQCRENKWPDVATTAVSAAANICEATSKMLALGISDDETEGTTETEAAEDPEALHDNAVMSTILRDSYE